MIKCIIVSNIINIYFRDQLYNQIISFEDAAIRIKYSDSAEQSFSSNL